MLVLCYISIGLCILLVFAAVLKLSCRKLTYLLKFFSSKAEAVRESRDHFSPGLFKRCFAVTLDLKLVFNFVSVFYHPEEGPTPKQCCCPGMGVSWQRQLDPAPTTGWVRTGGDRQVGDKGPHLSYQETHQETLVCVHDSWSAWTRVWKPSTTWSRRPRSRQDWIPAPRYAPWWGQTVHEAHVSHCKH